MSRRATALESSELQKSTQIASKTLLPQHQTELKLLKQVSQSPRMYLRLCQVKNKSTTTVWHFSVPSAPRLSVSTIRKDL